MQLLRVIFFFAVFAVTTHVERGATSTPDAIFKDSTNTLRIEDVYDINGQRRYGLDDGLHPFCHIGKNIGKSFIAPLLDRFITSLHVGADSAIGGLRHTLDGV